MENNAFVINSNRNPKIAIKVIPGHFATGSTHFNHYIDISDIKSDVSMAEDVAQEFAVPYLTSTLVDVIVCIEGTEVIGAYLAEELLRSGTAVVNSGNKIHVISPISNANGKFVFHDNISELILNHNVILVVASASSGKTIDSAVECITYYGGKIVGISSIFTAHPQEIKHEVHSVFTAEDFPDYKFYSPDDCELCKNEVKLDAIIDSEGYTKL